MHWPIREGLLCAIDRMREQARQQYMQELQMWATLSPHLKKKTPAPKPPPILRND